MHEDSVIGLDKVKYPESCPHLAIVIICSLCLSKMSAKLLSRSSKHVLKNLDRFINLTELIWFFVQVSLLRPIQLRAMISVSVTQFGCSQIFWKSWHQEDGCRRGTPHGWQASVQVLGLPSQTWVLGRVCILVGILVEFYRYRYHRYGSLITDKSVDILHSATTDIDLSVLPIWPLSADTANLVWL